MKHKLRKLIGIILTLCMIIPTLATGAVADNAPFTDIVGHWAENTITRWADVGIVNGYPDGTFKPDEPITRAELAKIVTLAFGLTERTESYIYDVQETDWYYDYVLLAAEEIPSYSSHMYLPNLMLYTHNGSMNLGNYFNFIPYTSALRYHVAEVFTVMKQRLDGTTAELPEDEEIYSLLETQYKDDIILELRSTIGSLSSDGYSNVERFRDYIYLSTSLGIMQGKPGEGGNYFGPFDSLTRAEVLTILDRIITPEQAGANALAAMEAINNPVIPEPVELPIPDGTVPESIDLADPKYNITLTRAEFAELLTVAFDLDGETSLELTDVDPNSEYYDYIKAAADYIPKFTGYEMRTVVDPYMKAEKGDFLPDEIILRMHASQAFTDIYELLYGVEYTIIGNNTEFVEEMTAHYADGIINDIKFQNYMGRGIPGNVIVFRDAIYSGFKLGIMNDRIGTDGKVYFLPYDALTLSDALYSIFKLLPAEDAEVFVSEIDSLSFMQAE